MILLQTQDLEWAVRSPIVAPAAAEVEEAWNIQVIQDVLIVANSASDYVGEVSDSRAKQIDLPFWQQKLI